MVERQDSPTDAMQVELQRLRQALRHAKLELVRLRAETGSDPEDSLLLEANQQLVLALLRGQAEKEMDVQPGDGDGLGGERDPLTGLLGRAALRERFDAAVAAAESRNERLAVLFLDLDHFKQVNDHHGHRAGDTLLRHVSRCLEASVRSVDTVSRHGGDEFVLLLTELSEPEDARRVAEKILKCVRSPERIGNALVTISGSVGISVFPDNGRELEQLIHHADRAMYRAKSMGSGHHAFYDAQAPVAAQAGPERIPAEDASNTAVRLRQSQMQEANEQLLLAALGAQELQSAAERARGDQTALLAVVAHELRNPLTPIRMAAGLLERAGPNELAGLRAVIERQLDHVSRLVGDLLDISRIHAGKLRLDLEPLDLCSLVPQLLQTCRPAIEARRQQLVVDVPDEDLRVNGDAIRLVQVVSNLLDNASKYTPEQGGIRLAMHGTPDSVVLTVTDTGIGIRPGAIDSVFHSFVQDSLAIEFNRAGLGIGLTVVRELVHGHGGTVTAASAGEGQGSTFVLTIPRLPDAPRSA
jgi:diguanylate cyclase (GGDEF)-like protein